MGLVPDAMILGMETARSELVPEGREDITTTTSSASNAPLIVEIEEILPVELEQALARRHGFRRSRIVWSSSGSAPMCGDRFSPERIAVRRLDQWLWTVRFVPNTHPGDPRDSGRSGPKSTGQPVKPAPVAVGQMSAAVCRTGHAHLPRSWVFPDSRAVPPASRNFPGGPDAPPPATGSGPRSPPAFSPRGIWAPLKRDRWILERFLEPED